jgi:hypothetical protein
VPSRNLGTALVSGGARALRRIVFVAAAGAVIATAVAMRRVLGAGGSGNVLRIDLR